jgi:hypothetical protein
MILLMTFIAGIESPGTEGSCGLVDVVEHGGQEYSPRAQPASVHHA